MKFTSLGFRTTGREYLAQTKDPRALALFAKSYRVPEKPKAQVQYLLAQIAGEAFQDERHYSGWNAWCSQGQRDADGWLWLQASRAMARHGYSSATWSRVSELPSPFLKAATIEALAGVYDAGTAATVTSVLDSLPEKGHARGLLLAAVADWLIPPVPLSNGQMVTMVNGVIQKPKGPPPMPVAPRRHFSLRLLDAVTGDRTPAWSQLAVARSLTKAWGLSRVTTDWRALRAAVDASAEPVSQADERYARPRFAGIEASGKRVCYVIDMSDSMLKQLSTAERQALRAPVTPASGPQSKGAAEKRGEFADLPWDKIRTRFDAAREILKLSIRGLDKEQSFSVVWFGTEAGLLRKNKGMRPATAAAKRSAIRALDSIKVRSATTSRPDGRLRGMTNLHAGMRTAFQVVRRGLLKKPEYTSVAGLEQGCDTVFLLSDGDPNHDDYGGADMCDT